MKEFEIQKSIPIPSKGSGAGRDKGLIRVAMEKLKVQESFFVKKPVTTISSYVYWIKMGLPERQYTCRTENGGTRIWRIK